MCVWDKIAIRLQNFLLNNCSGRIEDENHYVENAVFKAPEVQTQWEWGKTINKQAKMVAEGSDVSEATCHSTAN